jgi:hypothetical protein
MCSAGERVACFGLSRRTKALHVAGRALRFSETPRSLQPGPPIVNAASCGDPHTTRLSSFSTRSRTRPFASFHHAESRRVILP